MTNWLPCTRMVRVPVPPEPEELPPELLDELEELEELPPELLDELEELEELDELPLELLEELDELPLELELEELEDPPLLLEELLEELLLVEPPLAGVLVTVKVVGPNTACCGLRMPMPPEVASAGTVTVTFESLMTLRTASWALPTQAWLDPVKPEPVTVTTVPGAPLVGENPVIDCCL